MTAIRTSQRPLAVIILAAGQGTRMKSSLHKVLHPVAGRPMLLHLLASTAELAPQRQVVVVGAGRDQVEGAVSGTGAVIAVQEQQLGTGHAVAQAHEALAGFAGDVLILYGDVPLVRPETMGAMLDRLNGYLRATLAGSRATQHPLAQEFARLADYLELMAVRMGERLRFTLDLPEDLREVPVPPLLLQPLVENSIRHGLEPKVEGGRITVEAQALPATDETPALLQITVADTGVGLRHEAPPPQASDLGRGFGLTQVRERLRTLYGPRASLSLQHGPGGGTVVQLRYALQTLPPNNTSDELAERPDHA